MTDQEKGCTHGEIEAHPGHGARCRKCGAWARFAAAYGASPDTGELARPEPWDEWMQRGHSGAEHDAFGVGYAKAEAEAEKVNIAEQTESEIKKMREQADGEITRLAQQTRVELRRFSAEESVRLAEEKLRGKINADNDATLVKSGIEAIGGLN